MWTRGAQVMTCEQLLCEVKAGEGGGGWSIWHVRNNVDGNNTHNNTSCGRHLMKAGEETLPRKPVLFGYAFLKRVIVFWWSQGRTIFLIIDVPPHSHRPDEA